MNANTRTLVTRKAGSASYDPKTGTFTAVIATERPVRRHDPAGGLYDEILVISEESVDLNRLNSGRAPLLNGHRMNGVEDQVGHVERAWIDPTTRELFASIRLSARDQVKSTIWQDIESGVTRNVSIGYAIHETQVSEGDERRVVSAVRWEPYEVSLVPVPADGGAYVRSMEVDMTSTTETRKASPKEQRRIDEINEIATRHAIDREEAQEAIASGMPVADFRALVLDSLAARSEATAINSRHNDTTLDNPNFKARAMSDALFARMAGKAFEGPAREFAGASMIDIARTCLEMNGVRVNMMQRDQIARHALETRSAGFSATGDFPHLLLDSGNRYLAERYGQVESPLKALSRQRFTPDFRDIANIRLSEAPRLLEVDENAEVQTGSFSEGRERYRPNSYARIFQLTFPGLMNDDLQAFTQLTRDFARAAAETEADILTGLLTANGGDGVSMEDTNPLFFLARGNKALVGSGITRESMSEARQALRMMTDIDGVTPINATPRHLLVGPELEEEAYQLVSPIAPSEVAEVNTFAGALILHVDPRMSGYGWRVFADPQDVAVLEHAYLNGRVGPQMTMRPGFEVLGMEFRAELHFGAGVIDWRGAYYNEGESTSI